MAEHCNNYGSAATERKVYVGKVTHFFKQISVAEVLTEAATIDEGESLLWMGETSGVVEQRAEGLMFNEQPATHIPKGVKCSIKVPQLLRKGDKLYKMVPTEPSMVQ